MEELREVWTIRYDAGHRFGGASTTLDREPTKEDILRFCKNLFNKHGRVVVEKTYIFNRVEDK